MSAARVISQHQGGSLSISSEAAQFISDERFVAVAKGHGTDFDELHTHQAEGIAENHCPLGGQPGNYRSRKLRRAEPHQQELKAFEEILLTSRAKFVAMADTILRDKEEAEDAVQNAFLSAYLHFRSFEGRSALRTWLTRIVLNAALMVLRRRKRTYVVPLVNPDTVDEITGIPQIPDSQPDPEKVYADEETFRRIDAELERMSPALRQAFAMTYYGEMSNREACEVLGIPICRLKARVFRARKLIVTRLSPSSAALRLKKRPELPSRPASQFRKRRPENSKPFGYGTRSPMKEHSSSQPTEKPEWLAQIEAVLEMLNEGVVITSQENRVLFVNSRFVEMSGIPQQELLGAHASEFYSAQEWQFLAQQIAVVRHQGRHRYEFVLPQKDGGRLPVIVSSRILRNSGAEFRIITCSDISGQVRIANELRAANAKLQERQLEIEEDLRLAAQVQTSLAPKSTVRGNLTVDSFYHPVHSIGGDFAVVNWHDQHQVSLLMCDVSGHGIGSALVANRIYSETTIHLRAGISFTDMFGKLNRFLMEDIAGSGMFVTVAAARIDARQRRMHFAGAGHPPAMIARGSHSPVLLQSRSMVLGALPDAEATSDSLEVELEPDDRVVLYTDGITDVFNSRGEMLGVEGVQEIVREASALPAEKMKQGILNGVVAWRNGPATDDTSLMLVHVR